MLEMLKNKKRMNTLESNTVQILFLGKNEVKTNGNSQLMFPLLSVLFPLRFVLEK